MHPDPSSPPHSAPTRAEPAPDRWTTKRLLAWMSGAMTEKGVDSPRLSAEMLLSHVLGCDRMKLYTQSDRPASQEERDALRDLVGRALRHEPVQYLVGEAWFFGMAFKSDRRALIPRPSTETIIETILQHARAGGMERALRIADVCTGSGCIATVLAKHLPQARITATDISPEALSLARENAERHNLADRIEFREGDLLAPIAQEAGAFDYLASNPPYIPDHEWDAVEANVKDYEPTLALRGGPDGLEFVAPIIRGASELLAPGGILLVEIAACTEREALGLANGQSDLRGTRVLKDIDGLARVLVAERA